ncbi:TPA: ParB N-terminal domain-containing protein [Klebsiella quasipneumoniae subsp. quasipneumoniae]|nr:ParB N-terminal domain-containing protein [Klebsiella quasipneumoniae subsp. similipneumoniae]HBR1460274.1 ParB N-terminal domain-containing protein [Klebsiella quasipneumoniae subsp. quasipneumoniae]HBR2034383.1 ParB N-terminal domain-containing protein [Klebsiella quasipneumoniae subsp. quasipneumoniae]HCI6432390.1 ParB N-terminal domain-containing protein [Klebsiella quasipneumoniae subsp. similipneumoniae]
MTSLTPENLPPAENMLELTLDNLRPYENNPRITRNPRYEEIKASIRERGLDTPPTVTQRPGETHYVIRNGGNTRLSILRELWQETHDERFFRITCLYRPWSPRGEITALTGHLVENELRGKLTFIERALAVQKAAELYAQESSVALSQSELARKLTAEGYPVTQSHISRMMETLRLLLPCIPQLLYAGLGRTQCIALLSLHKNAGFIQHKYAPKQMDEETFTAWFSEILSQFDGDLSTFSFRRFQDECIGQLAERLEQSYELLLLEITSTQHRQEILSQPPAEVTQPREQDDTPPATDQRLNAIRRQVAEHFGETEPPQKDTLPAQNNSLYPVQHIWQIPPEIDAPPRLRIHIAQFAHELAAEAGFPDYITTTEEGAGFSCSPVDNITHPVCSLLLQLGASNTTSHNIFTDALTSLSDPGLIRLFRLLRLLRRLDELETAPDTGRSPQ